MVNNRDHLSQVQDVCTGDDAELVLGEVYGLREWSVYSGEDIYPHQGREDDMVLVGHFGSEWDLTQPLEGTCKSPSTSSKIEVAVSSWELGDPDTVERIIRQAVAHLLEQWSELVPMLDPSRARLHLDFSRTVQAADWLLDDPFFAFNSVRVPEHFIRNNRGKEDVSLHLLLTGPLLEHPVGHPSCTCGIYAYHDRHSLILRTVPEARGYVVGLVKAYGHVTVGTKGLRAAKAQTIAITLPQGGNVPDQVLAPVLERWKAANLVVLPSTQDLLDFADRGGYLENPEELQKELES